jgi:hypothetical protein
VRFYWPAVAVTVFLGACGVRPDHGAALKASVCSISHTPTKFDGRTVSVHAWLASNARDGVRLVDPACPDTAVLLVPHNGSMDKSVADLTVKLGSGGRAPTTSDRDVSANFTGVFRLSRDGVSRRTFELSSVNDVKITPKKP